MTASTTLTAVHYLGAGILVLIILLALACWWAYDAFERGSTMRQAELSQLRAGMNSANRNNNDLRRETVSLKNQLERIKSDYAQALEQQQLNHDQELQALRDQLAPLGPKDLNTLREMADKLNLAANALHATQQFSDSRQAKNLASAGHRIADQLARARATQEAA
jgi:predicted nuclease with TOPRIM domain